jgi:hypothetical protein
LAPLITPMKLPLEEPPSPSFEDPTSILQGGYWFECVLINLFIHDVVALFTYLALSWCAKTPPQLQRSQYHPFSFVITFHATLIN